MAISITIAPGSNTADVADKGIPGIPARHIARYAAKNPSSKRFELTVANQVYDVTVENEKPKLLREHAVSSGKVAKATPALEPKVKAKRIRPSRSKAAIEARAKKK
jgi:hypothetical protein